jgi:hypothetical protein
MYRTVSMGNIFQAFHFQHRSWKRISVNFAPLALKLLHLGAVSTLSHPMSTVKMTVFWGVAPCSLIEHEGRFRVASLKRQSSTRLHGATSQKTVIFMLAAVRTWNPTYPLSLYFMCRQSTTTVVHSKSTRSSGWISALCSLFLFSRHFP